MDNKWEGNWGRVIFRKDVWDCYWGQGKNWPIADEHVPCNDPKVLAKVKSAQGFCSFCGEFVLRGYLLPMKKKKQSDEQREKKNRPFRTRVSVFFFASFFFNLIFSFFYFVHILWDWACKLNLLFCPNSTVNPEGAKINGQKWKRHRDVLDQTGYVKWLPQQHPLPSQLYTTGWQCLGRFVYSAFFIWKPAKFHVGRPVTWHCLHYYGVCWKKKEWWRGKME